MDVLRISPSFQAYVQRLYEHERTCCTSYGTSIRRQPEDVSVFLGDCWSMVDLNCPLSSDGAPLAMNCRAFSL